ncbi:uncharacterized protein LOC114544937 [Dendronephthya gigantea]|uniref:uncharacterized protein LOC114544937 n=1 Tax=Dendronephthya gigantea TaxID=151771 RepID=UPI0010697F21|nr:uncharacterized protein LOC114544937 [Dendronephthya gigantea]
MDVSPGFQGSSDAEHPKAVIKKQDRRLQLAKLAIIAFVSIGTVVLIIIDVIQTGKSFQKKQELTHKIQGSIDTALVIHNLQKERGMTALQLGFRQLNFKDKRIKLREIRLKTNESIAILEKRDDDEYSTLAEGKIPFPNVLEEFRRKIDNGQTSAFDQLLTYRRWITKLISTLTEYTKSRNLEDYANLVYAYEMVILSKEEAGMERAVGGLNFIQGSDYTCINTTLYTEKRVLAEKYLEAGFLFSSELRNTYFSLFANTSHWMEKIAKKRKILSSTYNSSDLEAYEWFDLMTRYGDLILKLQLRQADFIEAKVQEKMYESTYQLVIRSLLLCFTLIITPCIIISLARVQKRFYEYTLSLYDKVELEQGRTDFLMRENARHVENLAEKWKGFSHDEASKSDK